MVENNNSELSQELRKAIRLQGMNIPSKVQEGIVPVIEVNPALLRRCQIVKLATRSTTGTSTLYTTPSNQDFYIVSASLSWATDAANDSTSANLNVPIFGTSSGREILRISKLTLTDIQHTVTISFPYPLKIDRNSNVTFGSSFTVGNSVVTAGIVGYLDEVSLA